MRISPPSSIWAIPWVTAFSTSGWRRSGGTGHARAASSATTAWESRSPKRTFSIDEELLGEVQLLGEGDRLARAHGEAPAQEVGEAHAELPRLLGPRRDEGVDRVQAVEEEVRVDLRAQGPQLRLARGDLELEGAPLGLLRGADGQSR